MRRYLKDKKITIYENKIYSDDYGYNKVVPEPIPSLTNIWAYYRHLKGKELFIAQSINYEAEVLFIINYTEKIKKDNVIKFRNKEFRIIDIDDGEGYKHDLKLYAKNIDTN